MWVTIIGALGKGTHGIEKTTYSKVMSKYTGKKITGYKYSYHKLKDELHTFFKKNKTIPVISKDRILGKSLNSISTDIATNGFSDLDEKFYLGELMNREFTLKTISEENLGPPLKNYWDKVNQLPINSVIISEDKFLTTWGIVKDVLRNRNNNNYTIKTNAKTLGELLCNYCQSINKLPKSELLSFKEISKILNINECRAVRKINKSKINYVSLKYMKSKTG